MDRDRAVLAAVITGACVLLAAVLPIYLTRHHDDSAGQGVNTGPAPTTQDTPGGTVANTFPQAYVGDWSGEYYQTNGRDWQIQVTIPEDSSTATVAYPELGCSGVWTVTSAQETSVTAREHITAMPTHHCTVFGSITLEVDGGALDVTYVPDDGRYQASAQLTRD